MFLDARNIMAKRYMPSAGRGTKRPPIYFCLDTTTRVVILKIFFLTSAPDNIVIKEIWYILLQKIGLNT